MGCCHTNSENKQLLLEEHEKFKDIQIKRDDKKSTNLTMIENFVYYEKNPSKNGKYLIKTRSLKRDIPILKNISESKLLTKRLNYESSKETGTPQMSQDDKNSENINDIMAITEKEIVVL